MQSKVKECTKAKDELRDATREINILKSEMHEIKSLLLQLVEKDADRNTPAARLKSGE